MTTENESLQEQEVMTLSREAQDEAMRLIKRSQTLRRQSEALIRHSQMLRLRKHADPLSSQIDFWGRIDSFRNNQDL